MCQRCLDFEARLAVNRERMSNDQANNSKRFTPTSSPLYFGYHVRATTRAKAMFVGLAAVCVMLGTSVIASESPQLDVDRMVSVIYRIEGGEATRWPYGIKSVKCADKAEAKRVCENTVRNNWVRWHKAGKPGSFTVFLANRYCPVAADANGNARWIANMTKIYGEI